MLGLEVVPAHRELGGVTALHLAVLDRNQLREDADGNFLRRDGADVQTDGRVHVAERVGRLRTRLVAKANEAVVDAMLAMATAPESAGGTPEQVVEKLKRMRELGCEYAILYFPEAAYDRSGIELFEREVIPALS